MWVITICAKKPTTSKIYLSKKLPIHYKLHKRCLRSHVKNPFYHVNIYASTKHSEFSP